jgi:glycosyltransferase involved in cell wall biosynthesis
LTVTDEQERESGATAPELSAPRISVVVPARNEARNLPHVLARIPDTVHQVILVDGHSVDDTIAVAQACRPDILVVSQTRRGKGNALACGFAVVTGDIVVMLDADGSADPDEIPAFVDALVAGADFAKGTRFAQGGSSHDITRFRRIGNAGLNGLVNALFGTRYTDLCYGYNAFWTSLLPSLELPPVHQEGLGTTDMAWGDGFEIETLINVRSAGVGARIAEVGSVELRRLHGVSNLNAVSDGLRVLRTILHERRLHRANRTRNAAVSSRADRSSASRTSTDRVIVLPDDSGPLPDQAAAHDRGRGPDVVDEAYGLRMP